MSKVCPCCRHRRISVTKCANCDRKLCYGCMKFHRCEEKKA